MGSSAQVPRGRAESWPKRKPALRLLGEGCNCHLVAGACQAERLAQQAGAELLGEKEVPTQRTSRLGSVAAVLAGAVEDDFVLGDA